MKRVISIISTIILVLALIFAIVDMICIVFFDLRELGWSVALCVAGVMCLITSYDSD